MFHLSCFNSTPFHPPSIYLVASPFFLHPLSRVESNRTRQTLHNHLCVRFKPIEFLFLRKFFLPQTQTRTENGISRINGACTTRYFVKKGGTREIREILQHARSKNWPTFFRRSLFTRGQISFLRVEGENRVNDSFRSFSYAKIWKVGGLFYGN